MEGLLGFTLIVFFPIAGLPALLLILALLRRRSDRLAKRDWQDRPHL